MKDRSSPTAVAAALQFGFRATSVVSSGNAGSSIAAYSARAGLRSLIFAYERTSAPKLLHMTATATDLVLYQGVYDDLITLWDRLVEERLFFDCGASRNAYKHEGKKTLAYEIAEQSGWRAPDVVVAPAAVGETFIATHRGFVELERLGWIARRPLMVAAQAARANAITRAWRGKRPLEPVKIGYTVAEGLAAGNPGRKGEWVLRILNETGGVAGEAEDEEILETQALLARTEGIWAGPDRRGRARGAAAAPRREGDRSRRDHLRDPERDRAQDRGQRADPTGHRLRRGLAAPAGLLDAQALTGRRRSRRAVSAAMCGSRSTPIHSRPSAAAMRPTVPAPANGSSTAPRRAESASRPRSTGSGVASHRLSGCERGSGSIQQSVAPVRPHRMPRLPEAQQVVDPIVPALARAHLRPEPLGLEPPAGAAQMAGDERVHPHPLGPVVPVADHEPEVAVVGQHPAPLAREPGRELARVALGPRAPAPAHPVGRRGQDDPDAAGGDAGQAPAVTHEETEPSVAARVALHATGGPPRIRRGRRRSSSGTPTRARIMQSKLTSCATRREPSISGSVRSASVKSRPSE